MENEIRTQKEVPGIFRLSKGIDVSLGMIDSLPISLEPGYIFTMHQEEPMYQRKAIPMPGRIVEITEDGHNIRIIPYETSRYGDKKTIHVFPHSQPADKVREVYKIMTNQEMTQ